MCAKSTLNYLPERIFTESNSSRTANGNTVIGRSSSENSGFFSCSAATNHCSLHTQFALLITHYESTRFVNWFNVSSKLWSIFHDRTNKQEIGIVCPEATRCLLDSSAGVVNELPHPPRLSTEPRSHRSIFLHLRLVMLTSSLSNCHNPISELKSASKRART